MRWRGQLSTKFLATGLLLLVLTLWSIGLTMCVTRQLDGGAAAVNEAGRMRMQAWRLASAQLAGQTPEQVAARVAEFETSLAVLRDGDAQRPLAVPWNDTSRQQFQALQDDWHALRATWLAPAHPDGTALFAQVDAFVPRVDVFVNTIEDTMARLTAVLNLFQFLMMGLAVAAAVFMIYVSYLFVIQPLQRIRQGLLQVEGGDFSVRLVSESQDEFGELAAGFNH